MKKITFRKIIYTLRSNFLHIIMPALAGAFICSLVILYVGYHYYPRLSAEKNLERTQYGISRELDEMKRTGDALAAFPDVAAAIAAEDIEALDRLIVSNTTERGTQRFVMTNSQGNVISRTFSRNIIGDNLFLNNPLGRAMAQSGEGGVSIQVSSIDPRQAILTSGRFVYQKEQKVGALLYGYGADDTYAQYFAKEYLPKNTQIAFYTKENGLSGTSITRPIGKDVLGRYLRPELELLKSDHSTRLIRMPDFRLFIAQNLWLPGAEESTTGLLIFTPLPHIYTLMALSFFLPLLLFLLLLVLSHCELRRPQKLHLFSAPTIVIPGTIYIVAMLALLLSFFNNFLPFQGSVFPLYNSILRFQPEGGVFDRRFPQRISVLLDSGGEAINTIRLSMEYNPAELKVQSVDMDRSICKHFIVSEHNSQTGHIEMECIIPNPGFKGSSAVLTDLFFKAEEETTLSSLHFLSDSEVLANDGLATNVLRMAIDSTIRFEDGQALENQDRLIVFSPTHSNPERWYSKKTVFVSWAPAVIGSVSLDGENPATSPFGLPPLKKIIAEEGKHFIHINAKNARGETVSGSLAVRIDTTPPEVLTLAASETKIKPGGLVRFMAAGSDSLSGLQRVFYLKINDEVFFPIGTEIQVPFPQAGNYTVTLRAYDKAGNYREVSKNIVVRRYQ